MRPGPPACSAGSILEVEGDFNFKDGDDDDDGDGTHRCSLADPGADIEALFASDWADLPVGDGCIGGLQEEYPFLVYPSPGCWVGGPSCDFGDSDAGSYGVHDDAAQCGISDVHGEGGSAGCQEAAEKPRSAPAGMDFYSKGGSAGRIRAAEKPHMDISGVDDLPSEGGGAGCISAAEKPHKTYQAEQASGVDEVNCEGGGAGCQEVAEKPHI